MSQPAPDEQPMAWRSLWAMVVGFFMILVDSTIVTVATPTIMRELNANVHRVANKPKENIMIMIDELSRENIAKEGKLLDGK